MSMIPYKLLQSRIIFEYASMHRIGQLFKRCFARYRLTPIYDVLSAYPVLDNGPGLLQEKKAKMAMALVGKNRHYKWSELHRRHLESTAKACGVEVSGKTLIDDLIATTSEVITQVTAKLPVGFPELVAKPILDGLGFVTQRLEGMVNNLNIVGG